MKTFEKTIMKEFVNTKSFDAMAKTWENYSETEDSPEIEIWKFRLVKALLDWKNNEFKDGYWILAELCYDACTNRCADMESFFGID